MKPSLAAIAILTFVLAGCTPQLARPGSRTWIAVTGPADSEAPEILVLEVGRTAWHGYGGVVSVETTRTLDVRLVGPAGCRIYAHFPAPAETMWVIRFANDGTVGVEDWTGRGMDAGPALGASVPSGC